MEKSFCQDGGPKTILDSTITPGGLRWGSQSPLHCRLPRRRSTGMESWCSWSSPSPVCLPCRRKVADKLKLENKNLFMKTLHSFYYISAVCRSLAEHYTSSLLERILNPSLILQLREFSMYCPEPIIALVIPVFLPLIPLRGPGYFGFPLDVKTVRPSPVEVFIWLTSAFWNILTLPLNITFWTTRILHCVP